MPWERSIGKASASKLKIYAKKDGRYDVSWYDQAGKRHVSTRQTQHITDLKLILNRDSNTENEVCTIKS
jgi:hypothetical protein